MQLQVFLSETPSINFGQIMAGPEPSDTHPRAPSSFGAGRKSHNPNLAQVSTPHSVQNKKYGQRRIWYFTASPLPTFIYPAQLAAVHGLFPGPFQLHPGLDEEEGHRHGQEGQARHTDEKEPREGLRKKDSSPRDQFWPENKKTAPLGGAPGILWLTRKRKSKRTRGSQGRLKR